MGTGVVYGMTISTAVGLFLIPVCYVFVQRIVERGGKKPPFRTPLGGGERRSALMKSETRNPKSEGSPKSEARIGGLGSVSPAPASFLVLVAALAGLCRGTGLQATWL